MTELGSKADLERDHIKVDGRLIHAPRRLVYIVLNKPNNTVTTVSDPQRRATVMELLRGVKERVYPVGRLDYHSEGLLLHDQRRRTGQRHHVGRHAPAQDLRGEGERLADRPSRSSSFGRASRSPAAAPCRPGCKLVHQAENPWYEVRLFEGRNNQIRLMFKHFGRLVEKLRRVRIGPIELGPLKPGQFRYLTEEEAQKLKRAAAQRHPTGSRMKQIAEILGSARTIAVVGLRPSATVPVMAWRNTCSGPGTASSR